MSDERDLSEAVSCTCQSVQYISWDERPLEQTKCKRNFFPRKDGHEGAAGTILLALSSITIARKGWVPEITWRDPAEGKMGCLGRRGPTKSKVSNRLLDSVGEVEVGKIWDNGIETCILLYVKSIASPGSLYETGYSWLLHWDDPEGWDGEGSWRGVQDGGHMNTHGWFMSMYGKNHYNMVK